MKKKARQLMLRLKHGPDFVDEITVNDCEKPNKGWRTFKAWKKKGFNVNKGEKATWFNGVAYFGQHQVTKGGTKSKMVWNNWDDDYDPFDDNGDSWFDPFDP